MDAPRTAADWIARLGLVPHPEGGWYRETYRAAESVATPPARFGGPRSYSTAIYFLLDAGAVSRLHRIKSDEVWHFYAGDPLLLYVIDPAGTLALGFEFADFELGDRRALVAEFPQHRALIEALTP